MYGTKVLEFDMPDSPEPPHPDVYECSTSLVHQPAKGTKRKPNKNSMEMDNCNARKLAENYIKL